MYLSALYQILYKLKERDIEGGDVLNESYLLVKILSKYGVLIIFLMTIRYFIRYSDLYQIRLLSH